MNLEEVKQAFKRFDQDAFAYLVFTVEGGNVAVNWSKKGWIDDTVWKPLDDFAQKAPLNAKRNNALKCWLISLSEPEPPQGQQPITQALVTGAGEKPKAEEPYQFAGKPVATGIPAIDDKYNASVQSSVPPTVDTQVSSSVDASVTTPSPLLC